MSHVTFTWRVWQSCDMCDIQICIVCSLHLSEGHAYLSPILQVIARLQIIAIVSAVSWRTRDMSMSQTYSNCTSVSVYSTAHPWGCKGNEWHYTLTSSLHKTISPECHADCGRHKSLPGTHQKRNKAVDSFQSFWTLSTACMHTHIQIRSCFKTEFHS